MLDEIEGLEKYGRFIKDYFIENNLYVRALKTILGELKLGKAPHLGSLNNSKVSFGYCDEKTGMEIKDLILEVLKKTDSFAKKSRTELYNEELRGLFSSYADGIKSKKDLIEVLGKLRSYPKEADIEGVKRDLEILKEGSLEQMETVRQSYFGLDTTGNELLKLIQQMFKNTNCEDIIKKLGVEGDTVPEFWVLKEFVDEKNMLASEEDAKRLLDYLKRVADNLKVKVDKAEKAFTDLKANMSGAHGDIIEANKLLKCSQSEYNAANDLKAKMELLISGKWTDVKQFNAGPYDGVSNWYNCIMKTAEHSEWAIAKQIENGFGEALSGERRDDQTDSPEVLSKKAESHGDDWPTDPDYVNTDLEIDQSEFASEDIW